MKQKVGIWCELVCVTCAVTTSGQFTFKTSVPRASMVQEAREKGWKPRAGDIVCRKCLEAGE